MKPFRIVQLSTLFAMLLCVAACTNKSRGITVTVSNQTTTKIVNVKLIYLSHTQGAGRKTISSILPGASKSITFIPQTPGLSIQYQDAHGHMVSKTPDVYFERGYTGTITLAIHSGGVMNVKSNIKISY